MCTTTLKRYVALSLSIFLPIGSLFSAVTFNGKDINDLLKPGQVLTYEDKNANNIVLRVKDNVITVGSFKKLSNLENVKGRYDNLEKKKDNIPQISSKKLHNSSGKAMTVDGAYFVAADEIHLEAGSAMTISDAIMRSKEIFLISNQLNLNGCFTDSEMLQIETTAPSSLLKALRFTFNKNLQMTPLIQGNVDFESNNTIEDFIVLGAQKVEIIFADTAFEHTDDEAPEKN